MASSSHQNGLNATYDSGDDHDMTADRTEQKQRLRDSKIPWSPENAQYYDQVSASKKNWNSLWDGKRGYVGYRFNTV